MELRESIDAILAEGTTLTDRVYEMLCESLTPPSFRGDGLAAILCWPVEGLTGWA